MSVRDRMTKQFTLFPRSTPVSEVVQRIKTNATTYYVVIQEENQLAATTLPSLKSRLSALADDFGSAALGMNLAQVEDLWDPRPTISPDGDEREAFKRLGPNDFVLVVEHGVVLGILANSARAVGSSALTGLYGQRFALFESEKPKSKPSRRTCPNCGKAIEFYKPKRVGEKIERYCPHCDFLIQK